MPQDVYSVLALASRYWFAFLGVLIVWRSFAWLRKDRRITHRRLKTLPDAGMIGELVVLQGTDDLPEDSFLPVPREGTLGYLRTCDVVVPASGVARHHLDFTFISGQGLRMNPRPGCFCMVDGELIDSRRAAAQFPMRHGSLLTVGDVILKLRLFAGLDAPYAADYMQDMPLPEAPQNPYPPESMPGYAPQPPYPQQPWQPPYPAYPEQHIPAAPPFPEDISQPRPFEGASRMNRRYHDEA